MGSGPIRISAPSSEPFMARSRTSPFRISSWICWKNWTRLRPRPNAGTTDLGGNTVLQARIARNTSVAACLRGVPFGPPRQGRRSRAGHDDEGLGEAGQLPDGHQHQGLAVYDPAQRILFADAQ